MQKYELNQTCQHFKIYETILVTIILTWNFSHLHLIHEKPSANHEGKWIISHFILVNSYKITFFYLFIFFQCCCRWSMLFHVHVCVEICQSMNCLWTATDSSCFVSLTAETRLNTQSLSLSLFSFFPHTPVLSASCVCMCVSAVVRRSAATFFTTVTSGRHNFLSLSGQPLRF